MLLLSHKIFTNHNENVYKTILIVAKINRVKLLFGRKIAIQRVEPADLQAVPSYIHRVYDKIDTRNEKIHIIYLTRKITNNYF